MPRKLGQHFLINKSAINKIIAALDLKSGDMVVEIGPGGGALTIPLAKKCRELGCKIVAIEKDPELVESIKQKVVSMGAEIREGDALKVLPELIANYLLPTTSYKVVGNIPYYITGKLLRILGELENKPKIIVLTIQREVAERVAAQPPKMNLLAAAVQIWSEPKIIGYLKPSDFKPTPKVASAIIKLLSKSDFDSLIRGGQQITDYQLLISNYYKLIRLIFKQPRKTVLNNLSTGLSISKNKALEMLKKVGLEGTERPQNLNLSQLLQLSRELE